MNQPATPRYKICWKINCIKRHTTLYFYTMDEILAAEKKAKSLIKLWGKSVPLVYETIPTPGLIGLFIKYDSKPYKLKS